MRWVTCVATPILLANVGDHRFRAFSLDPKRGDERIFGVHGDAVRLPFQSKPDGELHWHVSSAQYYGPSRSSMSSPRVANKACCAVTAASVIKRSPLFGQAASPSTRYLASF